MKKKITTLLISTLVTVVPISNIVFQQTVSALSSSQFNAGHIIDDAFFYQSSSMSANDIQVFLNSKVPTCDTNGQQSISYYYNSSTGQLFNGGSYVTTTRATYGQRYANWYNAHPYPNYITNESVAPYTCLKSYTQNTPSKNASSGICGYMPSRSDQTAANIIAQVSAACGVSPKVLLVLLQKEQGLITDDWPWTNEYQMATGYGCPDTSACNSTYYGFFNQVYNAAWQFKEYQANPTNFNYVAGQNNNIPYNPNSACGTDGVYIQNQATAGLYDYTPYVPNSAALANVSSTSDGGTGDSCSSYGNRNFWWYYNHWFGPTLTSIIRARSDTCGQTGGDCTQYVIYGGVKQGIPSNDVLYAWGINRLPLQTYTSSALQSIPTVGTLSRFMRSSTTGGYYFIDNAGYYSADSTNIRQLWGFPSTPDVTSSQMFGILNANGALSPYFSPIGSNTIAFIDGSTYHPFSSPGAFSAWRHSERTIPLTTNYFNQLTADPAVTNNRVTANGTDYVVTSGKRFTIPSAMTTSFPFSSSQATVSSNVIAYFSDNGSLHRFIRSDYNGAVYLLNGGNLYGLPSWYVWNSYVGGGSSATSDLGTASFDLVPQGGTLRTTIVKRVSNSTYYLLGNKVRKIPSSLATNYDVTNRAFTLDEASFQDMTISSENATPYVTSSSNPAVFLLDSGKRYGISNRTTLLQLEKTGEATMQLTNYDLEQYPYTKNMTNYLGSSSQGYVVDAGTLHPATPSMAASWGLTSSMFTILSSSTLSNFNTSTASLGHTARINGNLYFIDSDKYYRASSTYATLWGLPTSNNVSLDSNSLFRVKSAGWLDRFASEGHTIYTVDSGKLIGIPNLSSLFNLGYIHQAIVPLTNDLYSAMNSTSTFNGYLLKNSSATCYVADGGTKRTPNSASSPDWCYNLSSSGTTVSSTYLGILPDGTPLTTSIRANGDNALYAIKSGEKRWIPSNTIYYTYFDPFSAVSHYLRDVLPTGTTISSNGN